MHELHVANHAYFLPGVPYGFFHHPLDRRFPDGYPVLLDTRLSALRAEQALLFLRDGRYLSPTLTKWVAPLLKALPYLLPVCLP